MCILAFLVAIQAVQLPSGRDIEQLKDGHYRVVDFVRGAARGATVQFFVAAPPHACYALLSDVKKMPTYLPGLARIDVLQDQGKTKVLRYHSSYPLIPDLILERSTEDQARRITWTKIKAPFKLIDGSWDFLPVKGGTVLCYTVAIDTGATYVPNWMAIAFEKQGSAQLVRSVRRGIELGQAN